MRLHIGAALAAIALITSAPALAGQDKPKPAESKPAAKPGEPEKPMTDRDASPGDVAMTPLSDLNLKKGEIPPLLLRAEEDAYALEGLRSCGQIAAAVGELDAVLGDDIDVAAAKGRVFRPGNLAQEVIGAFIPFRGVIREVSGANAQDRKVQAAVYAGTARRAFLKGVGQQKGCRYPARSAQLEDIAAKLAADSAADPKNKDKAADARAAADELAAERAERQSKGKMRRRR